MATTPGNVFLQMHISMQKSQSIVSDYLRYNPNNIGAFQSDLEGVRKILLYAPGTPEGRKTMTTVLDELEIKFTTETNNDNRELATWHLLPMLVSSSQTTKDLRSHDLGAKLEDALKRARGFETEPRHGVVFLGMDAPILPLNDIVSGLRASSVATSGPLPPSATLCPAHDGGYAMLCVPPTANASQTFRNLYWSHPWTGMSQTKALTDQGIPVRIGTIVRDIDEACDVSELCHHLGISSPSGTTDHDRACKPVVEPKNLEFPGRGFNLDSGGDENTSITSSHPICYFTRKAIEEATIKR